MKRTISGMIGNGSLTHNRRAFIAENVDGSRTHLNVKYCDENLKAVYHELFDEAVKRYNDKQKRNDRKIPDYYEKIRTGKQEKLFHEAVIQIGNKDDMASGTAEGDLAVKVLDEYMQGFQERNPTLRVFNCYLHCDEATPHLHIDFVPYVTGWKGKGLDTKVSLKQALAGLGFKGGSRHDSEWNQWIEHEKEALAAVMEQHGIEWEKKGTHEEHLSVYDYKKKVRAEEVQALEQESKALTVENESLSGQIAEYRADIKELERGKTKAEKAAKSAADQAEKAKKEAKRYEGNLEAIKPMMEEVDKEVAELKGKINEILPKADTLELASSYRKNKALPIFRKMKNKIGALAAKLYEARQEILSLKKEQKSLKEENARLREENDYLIDNCDGLLKENSRLLGVEKMLERVTRVIGANEIDWAIRTDKLREQRELEAERKQQAAEPPRTTSVLEKMAWYKAHPEYRNDPTKKKQMKNHDMER